MGIIVPFIFNMKKVILIISDTKGGKKVKIKKGLVLITLLVVMVCSDDFNDEFYEPGFEWNENYCIDDFTYEQL